MATDLVNLSNELAAAAERAAASVVAVHGRRGIGSSGIAWRDNLIVTSSEGIRTDEGIKLLFPDGRTAAARLRAETPALISPFSKPTLAVYRRTEWQKTRDRNEAIDARSYARAAAAVYGMDRFNDAVWKTLEDRVSELSKRVGQPPVSAPPTGPPPRTIRGRFFTEDPPMRRW